MSPARPKLTLHPEACDGCGRCVEECRANAIRVGAGYIYVNWDRCDGCGKCVDYCDREAILSRSTEQPAHSGDLSSEPSRPATPAPAEVAFTRRLLASIRPKIKDTPDSKTEPKGQTPGQHPVSGGPWTGLDAWVVVVVAVLLTVGLQVALRSPAVSALTASGVMLARAGLLGVYYVLQIALLLSLAVFRHDTGFFEAFALDKAPSWRAWPTAFGLLVGTWLFSILYRAVAIGAGWTPPAADAPSLTQLFGADAAGMTLTVLVVVLLGPVVEELALRGVVQPALGKRYGRWWGIGGSAALFAALHWSLWSLVPLAVLGVALGWIADRYRSLWPAIALHVAYNGVLVAAALMVAGR